MQGIEKIEQNDPRLGDVLALIRLCFLPLNARITPPSSVAQLTLDRLKQQAKDGWVLGAGTPLQACVVLSPKGDALYLGKLSVHPDHRGKGHARALIRAAEDIAAAQKFERIELQVRVELVENQRLFETAGFSKLRDGKHPGFDHVTEFTLHKHVSD